MSRLEAALDPKSIAIIGASENPNKVGGRPVHYPRQVRLQRQDFPDQSVAHRGAGLQMLQQPWLICRKPLTW